MMLKPKNLRFNVVNGETGTVWARTIEERGGLEFAFLS